MKFDDIIKLFESGQSANEIIYYSQDSLRAFLFTLKNQIERWDLKARLITINSSIKDPILYLLGDNAYYCDDDNKYHFSGCIFNFTEKIKTNVILVESYKSFMDYRNFALGIIDLSIIERLYNLKSFW